MSTVPGGFPINSVAHTGFRRRPFLGGATAASCNQCSATVAVSHREAELDEAERQHVCELCTSPSTPPKRLRDVKPLHRKFSLSR